MAELHDCIDQVVSSGIQSYVGLLCNGELVRSRQLLADTVRLSSLAVGWSERCLVVAESEADDGVLSVRSRTLLALRGLLASLLLLRPTVYWARVPALRELQQQCARLNRCLDEGETGPPTERRHPGPRPVPNRVVAGEVRALGASGTD